MCKVRPITGEEETVALAKAISQNSATTGRLVAGSNY